MRELARPFLLPTVGRVRLGPWSLVNGEHELPLPSTLDAWDCASVLTVRRHLEIEPQALLRDCGLGADSELAAALVWSASSTKTRGSGPVARFAAKAASPMPFRLECVVPGASSGGILSVATVVTLVQAVEPTQLAATTPGSVLFEDSTQVALEGMAPQFPTAVCDFSADPVFPDRDAPWFLEWTPADLDLPPDAALLLWLNSRCEDVVDAATSDDSTRPELTWLRRAIALDTVSSLVTGALRCDEFVDPNAPFDPDSLATSLRTLLRSWFPGFPAADLADEAFASPDRFRARLMARMRLFGSEGRS